MDYLEEQKNEIEALRSIYFDNFQDISAEPPYSFQFEIFPYASESEEETNHVGVSFVCSLPEKYPDELPQIQILLKKGLSNKQLDELKSIIKENAQSCLGTVMIFSLASIAQNWLLEHNDKKTEEFRRQNEVDYDDFAARSRLTRFTEDKDAGLSKAVGGTPVTRENFLEWRRAFDEEMATTNNSRKKQRQYQSDLTGKQIFQSKTAKFFDDVLNAADDGSAIIEEEEEDEQVDIDDSLFLDEDEDGDE